MVYDRGALMMGLEEHLLTMFRGDFEFHDGAAASHLGRSGGPAAVQPAQPVLAPVSAQATAAEAGWAAEAQKELQKIPFFVRGKARRNTEKFAAERGLALITLDTLYEAKAHFGR